MSALDRLEELEQAATPAPWFAVQSDAETATAVTACADAPMHLDKGWAYDCCTTISEDAVNVPTAELIVALRNAAPALLRVVREARLLYEAQMRQILGAVTDDPVPPEDLSPYYGDLGTALDAFEDGDAS